jgi:phage terminase large subunit-like protein
MTQPLTDRERREHLVWLDKRKRFFRWAYFTPYPKQLEFLSLGASKTERLLMAGNRLGKTETAAFEATCHLIGRYPPWWQGRRFDRPVKMWAAGETSLATRDVLQTKLLGEPGVEALKGTGMIPKDDILDISFTHGITDSVDSAHVRHVSGGISIVRFKSYEQGRAKFQGEGLDVMWFDEEPSITLYTEGLTRIGEREGIAMMTFTPLQGRSAVVLRFMDEPSQDRAVVGMTIDDVPEGGHLTGETKAAMLARYPAHEREARARGVPMLGEGRIFMTPEEAIAEAPREWVPEHWVKLWGLDFGIGHPFAAVLMLWDKDNDVIHIHNCLRMANALSLVQVHAIKRIAPGVPVAWPHDGHERDRGSGEPLALSYKKLGLRMCDHHATWQDGSMSTEAGIYEWDEREKTGRLKVARHLTDWWEERRFYHRKDGKIVKIKDDLMSATRIAIMAKRFARPGAFTGAGWGQRQAAQIAKNVDFDVFTGEAYPENDWDTMAHLD